MAKINTRITLEDEVSPGLRNMRMNLDGTINTFKNLTMGLMGFDSAMRIAGMAKNKLTEVAGAINECIAAYQFQGEQELKLETVMRNHMNATEEQIQSVKDLADAEQAAGIYGNEMILAGAQELGTYVENVEVLKGLIPVLNSMVAQSYGTKATVMDLQSYATMMGKVMQGQVGGMSKRGYKFTKEEEEIFRTGTELQKLEILQKNVLGNFGDMNRALRGSSTGQLIAVSNALDDMKKKLGEAMMPLQSMYVITTTKWKIKFLEEVIEVVNFVKRNADIIKAFLITTIIEVGILVAEMVVLNWQIIKAKANALVGLISTHKVLVKTNLVLLGVLAALAYMILLPDRFLPGLYSFFGALAGMFDWIGRKIYYYVDNIIYYVKLACHNIWSTIYEGLFKLTNFKLVRMFLDPDFVREIEEVHNKLNTMKPVNNANDNPDTLKEAIERGATAGWKEGEDLAKWSPFSNKKMMEDLNAAKEALEDTNKKVSKDTVEVHDKNLVNIAEDYRELLTKRAVERFNLRYSSLSPNLTISNMNINSEVDVDNVIYRINNGLAEAAGAELRGAA